MYVAYVAPNTRTELATRKSKFQREGRGPLFQWNVGISVGFSTETTGPLRNPETRRTPSYTRTRKLELNINKFYLVHAGSKHKTKKYFKFVVIKSKKIGILF